jgi:hypothetical protein
LILFCENLLFWNWLLLAASVPSCHRDDKGETFFIAVNTIFEEQKPVMNDCCHHDGRREQINATKELFN